MMATYPKETQGKAKVLWIPSSIQYRAAFVAGACVLFLVGALNGGGPACWVFSALAGLLALRTLVIRVAINSDGVVVVNTFRSYKLKWEELEDVRYEDRIYSGGRVGPDSGA